MQRKCSVVTKESITHAMLRACVVVCSYRDRKVIANAYSQYPEDNFFISVTEGHGENQFTTKDWLIVGSDWTFFFNWGNKFLYKGKEGILFHAVITTKQRVP